MQSMQKLVHEEGFGLESVNLRDLATKYGVTSLTALAAAHNRALHSGAGPFTFSAPIVTGGLAALGGSVTVTLDPDGTVHWRGHMHDSGADGYDYAVGAVLRSPKGKVLAFAHSGHVGGTFTSGSRDDDWDEPQKNENLRPLSVGDFANATLATHLEYESNIGSFFEGLFAWVLRSAIGEAFHGFGELIFFGTEMGSLITTGSLVSGARIAEGSLWLAGPSNTLWALTAEGIASAGSNSKEVEQADYDWANEEVFRGALPPRDRLVITDTSGPGNRPFTVPRYDGKITLNLGSSRFPNPRANPPDGSTFIHELVHACQIDHSKAGVEIILKEAAFDVSAGTGYQYGSPDQDYTVLNLEHQAQIVEDWFIGNTRRNNTNAIQFQFPPKDNDRNPYFRYIQDNVRLGLF
ncbi:MAG: hypothetical protein JO112_10650 [Planctomycetes bacterium]|nr:hypothetical protein [Planctomycetota bacterium]